MYKYDRIKSIALHIIKDAYEIMLLVDISLRGICGILPPEGRQTFGSRLYKMLLDTVHGVTGIGNQNKDHKDELHRLYLKVVNRMKRQSETTCYGQ